MGNAMITNANALFMPMASESVQCVVTSPPYWGLRDYGVDGQLGLERTPEEYTANMVQVFRECWRVLRHDGVLWLNIGDSYLPKKQLAGIPWRVAFALQADGWYLRSDCIWAKPNPMPESVTDRPTKAHEYIFLLTKQERYFYDAEAVKETAAKPGDWPQVSGFATEGEHSAVAWAQPKGNAVSKYSFARKVNEDAPPGKMVQHRADREDIDYCGKRNLRTVWTIATQPTKEAHFATFPEALAERCIKAGTSARGCCPACGKTWKRVTERGESTWQERKANGAGRGMNINQHGDGCNHTLKAREILSETWSQSCACSPADPVPCVVFDPFTGSGTTGRVAIKLGRRFVGVELNMKYIDIAERRMANLQPVFAGCEDGH